MDLSITKGNVSDVSVLVNSTEVTIQKSNSINVEVTPQATQVITIDRNIKGDTGATGATGAAATIAVGTTTTGAAGSNASVTNSGTSSAAVFNFTIPQGAKGDIGNTGATGATGAKGDKGDTGAGVAVGGTTGQVLTKLSNTDYDTTWTTNGSGTVTSVAATAGTGISVSGSPITSSGTFDIVNTAPDQIVSLTASTAISVTGIYPNFTIANTSPDQTVVLTAGTGISTSGTYPNFTITNSLPDQVVSLTGAGTTTVTGTYPNFTITSTGGGSMVYPAVGIANSTGSAWGTSYSVSGTGNVALTSNPVFATDITVNTLRVGLGAGNSSTNVVVGNQALVANTVGTENIAIGNSSLFRNISGNFNVAIGSLALYNNNRNQAVGAGSNNTAIGSLALSDNASGGENTAIAGGASRRNTTGQGNTSIGIIALFTNTTGSNNIAIGKECAINISTGSDNVIIGNTAAITLTTGGSNVVIGRSANVAGATDTNSTVIGNGATGLGSNTTVIGKAATTLTKIFGALSVGADLTATSTTNIATGATVSGATNTINVGTGGVAGSTTTTTIGSATGTSTTILNGTVRPVSLSASQAVFTDASDNLVSVAVTGTGNVVLATAPTLTDPVITGTITEDVFALTDSATVDIDPSNGSIQTLTLAGTARTITYTNMINGEAITLMVNDGTAGTITTWNATFVNNGGVAPTLSLTGYSVVSIWKVAGVVYAALVGNA